MKRDTLYPLLFWLGLLVGEVVVFLCTPGIILGILAALGYLAIYVFAWVFFALFVG